MHQCKLVDMLAYPGWAIAVGRTALGYRCWIFTPELTVLDDGVFHPTREAATHTARCLIRESMEY